MYEKEILEVVEKNRKVFGKGKVKLSDAGIGENHIMKLAKINKNKFVFRILLHGEHGKNIKLEYDSLKKIPKGIAPEAVLMDLSKKIIPRPFSVLTFIEGKHIIFFSDKYLKLHASSLAKLQKKKYDSYGPIIGKKKKKLDIVKKFIKDVAPWHKRGLGKSKEEMKLYKEALDYLKERNSNFVDRKKITL